MDKLRLAFPFAVVVGDVICDDAMNCLATQHGYSGSPWLYRRKDLLTSIMSILIQFAST
jgi:hypothetical protein